MLTYSWLGLAQFLGGATNLGTPTTVLDDVGQGVEVAMVLAVIAGAVWLRRDRSGFVQ